MNIEEYIKQVLQKSLSHLDYYDPSQIEIRLERPKQEEHGDFSTNVALVLPAYAKKSPRLIGEDIISHLNFDAQIIEKVHIAGAGFINFYLGWGYYRQAVQDIVALGENYGKSNWGQGIKVQVEFVSANPTGPLNVVSARAAVVGDVVVNLLNAVGYDTDREYEKLPGALKYLRLRAIIVNNLLHLPSGFNLCYKEGASSRAAKNPRLKAGPFHCKRRPAF